PFVPHKELAIQCFADFKARFVWNDLLRVRMFHCVRLAIVRVRRTNSANYQRDIQSTQTGCEVYHTRYKSRYHGDQLFDFSKWGVGKTVCIWRTKGSAATSS